MNKPIQVVLLEEAQDYFANLKPAEMTKFLKAFDKTELGFKGDHFEKMAGTDVLFEFRVDANNKFHRMLAFWDSSQKTKTLVVCTHGFAKKTNKTPQKEIDKAMAIRDEYFSNTT